MDIVKEISSLLAVVIKFGNEEEALKQANDTLYGLVAAVFTKDITHGIQFSQKLRAGTMWINCVDCVYPNVPFRGYKQSGIGRECGQYALDTCLISDLCQCSHAVTRNHVHIATLNTLHAPSEDNLSMTDRDVVRTSYSCWALYPVLSSDKDYRMAPPWRPGHAESMRLEICVLCV
jgi:hypothetical protein